MNGTGIIGDMINERAMQILQNVVERYIRDGLPVASKIVARESELPLSSATIRGIMSDLEAEGLLTSPHVSAGRVPTAQGYRLFVDNLLTMQQPALQKIVEMQGMLDHNSDAKSLVAQASKVLSDVTQLVSVVMLPRRGQMILRQVEFLPLSERRVLVILVMNDYEVQNRVMRVERTMSRRELTRAGNFLTEHYAGQDLNVIRTNLLADMQADRAALESMLQIVMDIATDVCEQDQAVDCVVTGQRHLLDKAGQADQAQLRALFDVFAEKREVLEILDQAISAGGIQIYIGDESGHAVLDTCSVVTAPYAVKDKIVGVLGVIGPTRMPYRKVISAVDVTAKLLSQSFSEF